MLDTVKDRPTHITAFWLTDKANLCKEGVRVFDQLFPKGLALTRANIFKADRAFPENEVLDHFPGAILTTKEEEQYEAAITTSELVVYANYMCTCNCQCDECTGHEPHIDFNRITSEREQKRLQQADHNADLNILCDILGLA